MKIVVNSGLSARDLLNWHKPIVLPKKVLHMFIILVLNDEYNYTLL